ncbi:MAG: hypothetical protein ACLSGS_03375 [Adlercreutzia sp.]
MWLMLALVVVVCVAVLYVPGYLFARSLSVARFASVAIAPMILDFLPGGAGYRPVRGRRDVFGPCIAGDRRRDRAIALLVSKGIAAKALNFS